MKTLFRRTGLNLKPRSLLAKLAVAAAAILFALLVGVRIYNHAALQSVMDRVLEENPNKAIKVRVHFERYVRTGTLVFDVRQIGGPDVGASLLNIFFESASRLRGRSFESVKLAWRGRPFLFVDGAGFRRLGEEFGGMETAKLLGEMARCSSLPNGTPLQTIDRRVLSGLLQIAAKRARGSPPAPR